MADETLLTAADTTDAGQGQDGDPAKPDAADAAAEQKPDADKTANPDAQQGEKPDATQPDKPDADKSKDEDGKDKKEGAPETYADFTLPEGIDPDGEVLAEFSADAKELGLTQEAAQKLVDKGAKIAQRALDRAQEHQQKVWSDTNEAWIKEAKSDPELGGDGHEQALTTAKLAIDKIFAKPAEAEKVKQALIATGAGNHPEIIRAFYRVGKLMAEHGTAHGSTAPGKSLEQRMYPTMSKETP